QGIADEHGVTFLETDIDKDGGKIILVAGAPDTEGEDEERLLRTARGIADLETPLPLRIGVSRGRVFPGEDATAADADPQRQRRLEVRDSARRAKQPLLVLALGVRRARDEDDLAAVLVDVRFQERDAMLVCDALRARYQLLERRSDLVRAARFEQLVDAAVVHERHRGLTMLRLHRSRLEVPTHALGHAGSQIEAVEGREGLDASFASPSSRSGSSSAVSSLIRISPASAAPSISTVRVTPGPVRSSSRCESP